MKTVETEIEFSPLSGNVTHDGVTLLVRIHRVAGGAWSLEVIDQHGMSTVWRDTFSSDNDALDEFHRTVEMWKLFTRFALRPVGELITT